jgi:hypothetical protein
VRDYISREIFERIPRERGGARRLPRDPVRDDRPHGPAELRPAAQRGRRGGLRARPLRASLGRGTMKTTYHGSCHCGAVSLRGRRRPGGGHGGATAPVCWKQRMWTAGRRPRDFRLLSRAGAPFRLTQVGDWGEGHHRFGKVSGIHTHGHGRHRADRRRLRLGASQQRSRPAARS